MSSQFLKIALLGDAGHINIQNWCEALTQGGAEIHLISFRDPTAHTKYAKQFYRLPGRPLPGKLHYFTAVPYTRRLIRKIKPYLVIGYYVTGYGTLASWTGFRPMVLVSSGSDVLRASNNLLFRVLLRYNLTQADLVTAWAPHMAAAVKRLGAPIEKTMTLPRGIPVRKFAINGGDVKKQGNLVRLIHTRALRKDYNIEMLLRSLKLLNGMGISSKLTLAGEGPQKELLVALVDEMSLGDQVDFAGFVPNDQLPSLLRQHDIYISLIESDGVSASLLEGMASGLIPIVPDNPANRHWIRSRENGLLLTNLSPEIVANSIRQAIENQILRLRAREQNPGIISQQADMYRNGKIFVERFRQLVEQR